MPRFDLQSDEQILAIPGSSFQFSAVKPSVLEATEYTLVTIVLDKSGSLSGFENDLLKMEQEIIRACQKNPRSENLMVRLLHFNSRLDEVHGFRTLAGIDAALYVAPNTDGSTALFDATFSGIGACLAYANQLRQNDFEVNGAVYIITDGEDNASAVSPSMIADLIQKSKKQEDIESLITVLIGMGSGSDAYLDRFKTEAELDQFVAMGQVTAGKLAKLAGFISKSISSASQSLGTGGPSAPVALVI
jgi:uncharacterized protein YegL